MTLTSGDRALSRFAGNPMTQNLQTAAVKLTVASHFGQRVAAASTGDLSPEAIAATLRRSGDLARVASEDPEWVPLLPQTYADRQAGFDAATAASTPGERGRWVQQVCQQAQSVGVEVSGSLSCTASSRARLNSQSLQAYTGATEAEFNLTARQGNGSSWRSRTAIALSALAMAALVP